MDEMEYVIKVTRRDLSNHHRNVAMLVRRDEDGKYYLYDIMKIKKKRAIFSSQMTLLSNKTHFLIIWYIEQY